MREIKLKSGHSIPVLGFGTTELVGDVGVEAIKTAISMGYRHIDTATMYGNHEAIAQAIAESGVDRSELYITSKIPPQDLSKSGVTSQTEEILTELDTDYLDMLLIHWPNSDFDLGETLETLTEMKQQGKAKSIGVSNFSIRLLKQALDMGIEISTNQVEYHPSLNQQELLNFCQENGITITAYAPLARGQDLKIKEVVELADKYQKPANQVVLNWLMAKDIIAIPRSDKEEHMKSNLESTTWELDPEDVKLLDGLNTDNRLIRPDFVEFNQ
ncbi:MAG: aldo/keto reductase [Candidatus Saccharimonadales bacterium]